MDNSDDLTFRIIFSGDGAGRLRDKVKEKLKEFMGDYTDDTLVEYVIVLLKNGRRKEEARNELNVFLGDDSDSFVSWLWDHLRSNLNLYAQPKEEVAKPKKEDGRSDLIHSHLESEGIKSIKASKNRVSKDWKGVLRDPDEPPPLRSAVVVDIGKDDKALHGGSRMKRSPSPQPLIQRKRGRNGDGGPPDERSQVKREPNLGASRRLLQFAVRDAVATSRSPSEPSLKRLRSVVSTPNEDEEHRPKIRSVAARVPKAMAVAIKAVADAAKDVVKVKPPSGNVFDRLGRSADLPDYPHEEHDGNHMDFTQVTEATVPSYYEEITYGDDLDGRVKIGNSGGHLVGNESTMVNIASVNTVKPRAVLEMENRKVVKENSNRVTVSNGNGATTPHAQREVQKMLPLTGVNNPTGRPTEDVDSRTIFVSNVHFGATKDSLSRHFNKFGDVLKVVIVTEAATGQPKGSAYVEFMRKEAAENALSLDGTSFMSRIIKVVRKSSVAHQEPAQVAPPWPRVSRGSPFTASRFGRVPFPRGGSTLYRPRLPLKPGARSLQWKRDSSENVPSPTAAASAIPSPTTAARSLTYIRPEAAAAKTDGNLNNA